MSSDIRQNYKEELAEGDCGIVKCAGSGFVCRVQSVDHSVCQTAYRMYSKQRNHMKHSYNVKVRKDPKQLHSRNFNIV
jgi:hypothetical protein